MGIGLRGIYSKLDPLERAVVQPRKPVEAFLERLLYACHIGLRDR
jgi:hypothetical protein